MDHICSSSFKVFSFLDPNVTLKAFVPKLLQLRRVFVYALRQKSACPDFQWYYNIFSNDMVILNSAVNFIIYTVCGKRFR